MKQTAAHAAAIAAILGLLLILCAPAGLAEEASPAIEWDMTIEDILALEGAAQDEVFIVGGGEYTQYGLLRVHPEFIGAAVYICRDDALVMYGETVNSSMQRQKAAFQEIYDAALAALAETYGEPTIAGPQRAIDAANTIQADALAAEDILADASWDLEDGTMLYHVYTKTGDEENIYTMYVNESLLYQE